MEALSDHWGPILIAVISAAGTALVTLLKIRGDKETSVPSHYQGLFQAMQDWTNTQLEQRDRTIEQLRRNDEEQGSRIENLERELRMWKGKFWQAIEHIRVLRSPHRDRDVLPPVPESLRDDLMNN